MGSWFVLKQIVEACKTVKVKALFLFNPADLYATVPGGVQRCTREFLDIILSAYQDVQTFEVDYDRTVQARLKRRSRLFPYSIYDPRQFRSDLQIALERERFDAIFLNRSELIRFVPEISGLCPGIKIVVMSHGNESGDLLYEVAMRKRKSINALLSQVYDFLWLGGSLVAETRARHADNFTLCVMSHEEEILERWLGAKDILILPRAITPAFLDWVPTQGRAGYVGSLHHTPNIVALEAVLTCLARRPHSVTLEIVGRPEEVGRELERKFSFVRYLGALSDDDLNRVACRWSVFLNPIFWLSKGASMKLAQALAWGLPVLTTRSGLRGYEIPDKCVIECADNAVAFVDRLVDVTESRTVLQEVHSALEASASSFPTVDVLGARLQNKLSARAPLPS